MVKGGSEFCLEDGQRRACVVTEIQAMGAVRSQESRGGYSVISLGRVPRTGVLPPLLCSLVAAGTEQTV